MTTLTIRLKARDIMTPDPVCVEAATTIRQLARVLEENQISGVPVVDQNGAIIGVVSKTDLFRRCAAGADDAPPSYLFEIISNRDTGDDPVGSELIPEPLLCVDDFMTRTPVVVGPDADAPDVAQRMLESRIHRVIVVDASRVPIGIITSLDLLTVLTRAASSAR